MRSIFIICLIIFPAMKVLSQPATVDHLGQPVFASGINLAWIKFSKDLGSFNEEKFTKAVVEVSNAKGNVLRWWLHTNGKHSPVFSNGKCSGIDPKEIVNLKRALDIAYKHGIMLDLCLWSFDMLQSDVAKFHQRNKDLISKREYSQAYIDNALIPLVKSVKGHPGILCWEIFNEPEGMINGYGWTPTKVDMIDVQQFVNLVAGAIHRTDPSALVSNGSWSMKVLTDADGNTNFYSPQRLKAIGGDSLGYLDFYMVHYYPQNNPIGHSPFHHPASYWKLDKPIMIGEFPALGIKQADNSKSLTTEQAYEYAFNNGYAGILSWTYTRHDGNGGLPECASAMTLLYNKSPKLIQVKNK
jgi:hypothetical protein